ncbi:hypothetical protein [Thiomicrorhabdus indica]|uniref:hypothetical protein n=1 Tax=Thiomicrorhabdus indica TaxID=2267253 RepID=UPI00102D9717|nr:hypothetical protein [Thiomicrorhabdus indica]
MDDEKETYFNNAVMLLIAEQKEDATMQLRQLFTCLAKEAKIRDQWSYKWSALPDGISLYALSEKQQHEYSIGIFQGKFYIESNIYDASLLKTMKPKYWAILAELDDSIDSFKFSENAVVSNKVNFDLKSSKSSIFNLMRNYVLLTEHEMGIVDIGQLGALWPISQNNDFLENEATKVLTGLHQLNYLMYRNEYIRAKSRDKYK